MNSVVGIFNSFADAKRGAAILRSLGIPEDRLTVLAPGTSTDELEANIPTTESEQPGMGKAVGGAVGGALGVAGGLEAGMVAASLLIPGVGPVLAFGLLGAALLGAGGVAAGAAAGEALEGNLAEGMPRDELFVYEDALRRGRSLVIAFADDEETTENARAELLRAGAESVDAAREEWWIGLRDAEQEHYIAQGGDFKMDEAKYRLGFEAALHPDRRGKSGKDLQDTLRAKYGEDSTAPAFRQGYDRGQHFQREVLESYRPNPRVQKHSVGK
jgi:hypothetical protein